MELQITDPAIRCDIVLLHNLLYYQYSVGGKSNNLPDLRGLEGKAPLSVNEMHFSWKQFSIMICQPSLNIFNKFKKQCTCRDSGNMVLRDYLVTVYFETAVGLTLLLGAGSRKLLNGIRNWLALASFVDGV